MLAIFSKRINWNEKPNSKNCSLISCTEKSSFDIGTVTIIIKTVISSSAHLFPILFEFNLISHVNKTNLHLKRIVSFYLNSFSDGKLWTVHIK